jgi:hypothetical protein
MSKYQKLVGKCPNVKAKLKKLFKVLCNIEDMAGYTPASVGESDVWTSIVNAAEDNWENYCKALSRKTLYNALYGTYRVTLSKLKTILKVSIFSEENKAKKTWGKKLRKKAFKKFRGVSSAAPKRSPKLQRKWQYRPKCLWP